MKLLFYDTSCARVVQVGSVGISSTPTATKRPLFQLIYNCRVKEEQAADSRLPNERDTGLGATSQHHHLVLSVLFRVKK